jgi:antitoxin component of MazEF toxin-antitoxin module
LIKKLTRHGNSLALVIERPILELLNMDSETPVEITTDGNVLIVSPVRDEARADRLTKALERANQKYGRALKRLAE